MGKRKNSKKAWVWFYERGASFPTTVRTIRKEKEGPKLRGFKSEPTLHDDEIGHLLLGTGKPRNLKSLPGDGAEKSNHEHPTEHQKRAQPLVGGEGKFRFGYAIRTLDVPG